MIFIHDKNQKVKSVDKKRNFISTSKQGEQELRAVAYHKFCKI